MSDEQATEDLIRLAAEHAAKIGFEAGVAQERAAWVAKIEALADDWERTCSGRVGGRWTCKPGSRCRSCTEAVTLAFRLRALLSSDATETPQT